MIVLIDKKEFEFRINQLLYFRADATGQAGQALA